MKIAFIASPPFSGSTLLEMLLGCNEGYYNLGEINLFNKYYGDPKRRCTCGSTYSDCSFWKQVEKEIRELHEDPAFSFKDFPVTVKRNHSDPRRVVPELLDLVILSGSSAVQRLVSKFSSQVRASVQSVENVIDICNVVSNLTDAGIIVDSSKEPAALSNMLIGEPDKLKVIRLLRDGRGVCNSMTKHLEIDFVTAVHYWRRRHFNLRIVMRKTRPENLYTIRYEDLATNTGGELTRLGEFLGQEVSIDNVVLDKDKYHSIGGNPMRFRREESAVRLDENWKEKLSSADLEAFEKIGGKLNRQLGY